MHPPPPKVLVDQEEIKFVVINYLKNNTYEAIRTLYMKTYDMWPELYLARNTFTIKTIKIKKLEKIYTINLVKLKIIQERGHKIVIFLVIKLIITFLLRLGNKRKKCKHTTLGIREVWYNHRQRRG